MRRAPRGATEWGRAISAAPAGARIQYSRRTRRGGLISTTPPASLSMPSQVRMPQRCVLIELIDYHDEALAEHFSEGKLALESYKEYIELFARSLKETMESREGVSYLLRTVGFDVRSDEINLNPELRWKRGKPGAFGRSLL